MSGENKIILAFDAYGTLLSTESIAEKLASHFGKDKAQTIATTWRKYQLEYTWRLNSMNQYEDFSKVTKRALQNALSESSVTLSQPSTDELMKSYDSLSIFPDVSPALTSIAKNPQFHPVIFSNGTYEMVSNSIHKSPQLSPHAATFKSIVVVEEPKRYKPAPEVYFHLAKKVGKDPQSKEDMQSMWLISGNPFDVVGARAVGMRACWVDRSGNGWQDGLVLGDLGRPSVIVKSLEEVPDAIAAA